MGGGEGGGGGYLRFAITATFRAQGSYSISLPRTTDTHGQCPSPGQVNSVTRPWYRDRPFLAMPETRNICFGGRGGGHASSFGTPSVEGEP